MQMQQTPDAPLPDDAVSVGDVPEKKGFLSTTTGRIVLIGGAVAALLVVAGVAFFLVSTFLFVDEAVDEIGQQIQQQAEQTQQGQDTTATAGEGDVIAGEEYSHADVEYTQVHVWRDVFQPLLTPVSEDASGTAGDGGTSGGGTTTYNEDTLYLLDIFSGSSESAAQFYYNGIDYNTTTEFASEDHIVVREGERLDDTPWRLLNIDVTSVTVQYGDSTYVLSIGQGISK
jgi:cell division protein FtsL